jgi:pyruvate formate lyase activating enzyme
LPSTPGRRYAFTGNVHDAAGSSTYCASCGVRVIERDWYQLGEWRLGATGRCDACGAEIAGRFDVAPGCFGARQIPLRVH